MRWVLLPGILGSIAVGLTIAVWVTPIADMPDGAWPKWLILLVVCCLPLLRACSGHAFDPFEPVYLFTGYFAILILARGAFLMQGGTSLHLFPVIPPDSILLREILADVFLYSAVGLVSLYIGYYSSLGVMLAKRLPKLPAEWQPHRVNLIIVFGAFIGIFAVVALVMQQGGIEKLVTHLNVIEGSGAVGLFFLVALTRIWTVGFLVLYLDALRRRYSVGRSCVVITYGIVMVMVLFATTGSKTLIVGVVLSLLIFRHYLVKSVSLKRVSIALGILLSLLPVMYAYRVEGVGALHLGLSNLAEGLGLLLGRSYSADSFARILIETDQTHEYLFGASMVEILYFWIPRILWTEKPYSFGWIFGIEYSYGTPFSGKAFVAPSLVGELYLNFHVAGVIFGFVVFGALLKAVYVYLCRRHRNRTSILLYGVSVPQLVLLAEGPIASHVVLLLTDVVPAVVVLLVIARRRLIGGRLR